MTSTDVLFKPNPAPVPVTQVGLGIRGLASFSVGGSHSKSSRFVESRSKSDKFSYTTHDLNCEYYT